MDQIQPPDVFFNRQMKINPRRLCDHISLDELDISNVRELNNIICLTSYYHNQLFSILRYLCEMIRYTWYTSSDTDKHSGVFKTLAEVCFLFDATVYAASPIDMVPFNLKGEEMLFVTNNFCRYFSGSRLFATINNK